MKFKYGTDVFNAEEEKIGEVENVVIDPREEEVSHLVVSKGFLFTEDKLVPLSLIAHATEEAVTLHPYDADFEDLKDYQEEYYVKTTEPDRYLPLVNMSGLYMYTPVDFSPAVAMETQEERQKRQYQERKKTNLPEGAEPIQKDTNVFTYKNEHLGDVEEVIVDSVTDQVTHFVVSKGILLQEEKLIPAEWVKEYDREKVVLAVNKETVNSLPAYQ